jgi:spore maturation protein CgeB
MRILLAIPGHLKTVPMGRFSAEALRELGHEVTLFDFHPRPLEKFHNGLAKKIALFGNEEKHLLNRRFRRAFAEAKPDLFIALYGFHLSAESLAHVRARGVPSACWWLNDPFQFDRSRRQAARYDFIFSNCATSAEKYLAAGIKNAFHLPTACAPEVHRKMPAEEKFRCDVCFAGDHSPLRAEVMTKLAAEFDVKIFGPWAKHLPPDSPLRKNLVDGFFMPEEMARMFAGAKIVLNLHTWHGKFPHGTNPRLFEAAGCSAFQLVDFKTDIPALFDVKNEVRCFEMIDELPAAVCAALADDSAREQMAAAAQSRAYHEHTYVHRMTRLLNVVKSRS